MEFQQQLARLSREGRLREFRPLSGRDGSRVVHNELSMLNLTSNDYLGLAGDVALQRNFYDGLENQNLLDQYGLGVASSRLLAGDSPLAHTLEQTLRQSYGKEACLLFNSGYHANIGILPALLGKGDIIFSDKLNHASITDGMRLSNGTYKRYRHLDYAHLKDLLEQHRNRYHRAIIVTESVFSMDGDVVNLRELTALKEHYNCLLYVDEAHAVGLYGEKGLGKAEEQLQLDNIDILVGTFGKALASVGAFVLCSDTIRNYLINYSRSLIFTTALPPVVLHWNQFSFQHMLTLGKERTLLHELSEKLRADLVKHGLHTDGSTNIIPVMIGKNEAAVQLAKQMRELGYFILPVRPPAVPEGTARFRLSLTANMEWQELAPLSSHIAQLFARMA